MKDENKTKKQLIEELKELRRRAVGLEESEGDQKPTREALVAAEEIYRTLFKNNHSVMLLIDPVSAEIVDANPAACSFYGWTHEELTSMKITDINMLSNEQVFQEMERAKSQERNHFFFRHRLANEEIRDVEVYSGPIRVRGKELLYSIIHDISERKRAEEALRESEHYFRSLLFNLHEDILVIDRDLRITDVNNSLLVTVGLKREEVVGSHCYEVSHGYNEPCDRKGEECALQEVFETGDARNCRHQHIHADGSKVWVDILLSPLRNESGKVTHVIEAIRDVTDLIAMEKVLGESQLRYETLVHNAPVGIWHAKQDGSGGYINPKLAEMTGLTPESAIGCGWATALHPDDKERVFEEWSDFVNGKAPYHSTYRFKDSDGKVRWVIGQAMPTYDGYGELAGYIGTLTDITEHKHAELELKESQGRYHAIFDGSRDAMFITDTEAKFVDVNQAATTLTGYPREELLGMKIPDLHEEVDLHAYHAFFERIMAGESMMSEAKVLRKDGTKVDTEFSNRRVMIGNDFYMHTIARDISVRKQVEEDLKKSEERYRMLVERMNEGLAVLDENLVLTYANNRLSLPNIRPC